MLKFVSIDIYRLDSKKSMNIFDIHALQSS